ncbi:MAG TPA: YncE family protein [Thermosulfidibacter takaii]|uniref:YncE family protein n=1 Tax=Thermosulfidibacter takaii TaxID=412593 RepID=A0A7C0Y790_9BACT|nr:YncE family protein [Thermosulfidibacter takaii]
MSEKPFVWWVFLLVVALFISSPALGGTRVSVYLALKSPVSAPVWFKLKGLAVAQDGEDWTELKARVREVDSSKVGRGQVFLGIFEIPRGSYTRLRLTLEKAALKKDGKLMLLSLAQKEAEFRISPPLNLRDGDSTCLFLTWDVDASVKGGFSFEPVIHVKPQAIPIASELLYVTCDDIDTLYVIRADKNWVVGSLGLGGGPKGLKIDKDLNRLYVVDSKSRDIKVVELSTNRVVDSIMLPFVLEPTFIELSPDGAKAYVTDKKGNYLLKLDLSSGSVEGEAELGHGLYYPLYVEDEGVLAVSSLLSQLVYLVDPADLRVRQEVRVGVSPEGLLVHQGYLYVADRGSGTVTVYSFREGRVLGRVNVGAQPRRIVGSGSKVYVSNYGEGTLSILLPGRTVVFRKIAIGGTPLDMAVCERRRWLYVLDRDAKKVKVLGLTSERLVTAIPLGGTPFSAQVLQ